MIDHFNLPVSNSKKSLAFYQLVLQPLGYKYLFQDQDAYGFGLDYWQFGLYQTDNAINPLHIAFKAKDRASVDMFYQLAIKNGAKTIGKPGLREQYGPNYYAAFVLDFDGHNIEAVCRMNA